MMKQYPFLCALFVLFALNASEPVLIWLDIDDTLSTAPRDAYPIVKSKWIPNESFNIIIPQDANVQFKTEIEEAWKQSQVEPSKEEGVSERWIGIACKYEKPNKGFVEQFIMELGAGIKYPMEGADRALQTICELRDRFKDIGIELHVGPASNMGHRVRLRLFQDGGFALKNYVLDELVKTKKITTTKKQRIMRLVEIGYKPFADCLEEDYAVDITFEKLIESESLPPDKKLWKPNPAYYTRGLEEINERRAKQNLKPITPTNVIFVDDLPENVAGARIVGLRAFHATNPAVTLERVNDGLRQMFRNNEKALRIINELFPFVGKNSIHQQNPTIKHPHPPHAK